jgi:uncharacterized alpha/beta hydrolase family protein
MFTVFLCPLMYLLVGYSENNTKRKKQIKDYKKKIKKIIPIIFFHGDTAF